LSRVNIPLSGARGEGIIRFARRPLRARAGRGVRHDQ
jgi:hypothetical protein